MFITLAEAASILGVTKETLRNWDKSGKLRSSRDPKNNYRMYLLSEVETLQKNGDSRAPEVSTASVRDDKNQGFSFGDEPQDRDLKRALTKINKIIRDTDGNSSIIERFDETTKLIFLKLLSEQNKKYRDILKKKDDESLDAFSIRVKVSYIKAALENKELFPERFREIKLSNLALASSALAISGVELSSAKQDVKGFAYEEMVRSTFDKGDNQQFFTPQPIVEFLSELLRDKLTGVVCDPACGTGGFLVEITKNGIASKHLIGLEIDDRLAWVAGINLLVHGALSFETHCIPNGGSLGLIGRDYFGGFDTIITNPPFGSDFSDKELSLYALGAGRTSRRRGVLFIERCLDMLKEEGILGIIIDDGVLSLQSNADVRDLILKRSEVLAVISLPETAFMPYASVSTSILVLKKKSRPHDRQITFFARAESIGRKANGDPDVYYDEQGNARLNSSLPDILSAWKLFERTGSLEKQTDDLYISNPLALIGRGDHKDNRLDFKFHHPARLSAQAGLSECRSPLFYLNDLCEVRSENFVPSVDFPDQLILYTGLANIEARVGQMSQATVPGSSLKSGVRKYYPGDILFAKMRPALRKVSYVSCQSHGYASGECIVLKVKKDDDGNDIINPFLLSVLLRSDYVFGQIVHLIAGIGRPRIGSKDLLKVRIPVPTASQQAAFMDAFLKTKENYEALRSEARRISDTAKKMELQAIESVADAFIGKR